VYAESIFKNQPSSIKIPKVINHKWFYVMENLNDYISIGEAIWKESIKRNFTSKWIRNKIDALNHMQVYELARKLYIDSSAPQAYDTIKQQVNIWELKTFLKYTNSVGLRHWEITPEHIMVPRNPKKKWVAIVDFGKDSLERLKHDRKNIWLWDVDFYANFADVGFLDDIWETLVENGVKKSLK
jgi:hypothetical protein